MVLTNNQDLTSGLSKTHGEKAGEKADTSELQEVKVLVVLINILPLLPLPFKSNILIS